VTNLITHSHLGKLVYELLYVCEMELRVFQVFQDRIWSPSRFCPVAQSFCCLSDDIVNTLSLSQRHFIILYADDILIMAPSVTELQRIVSMCDLSCNY